MKDDIRAPEGDVGEKIEKFFRTEKKAVKAVVLSSMGEEVAVGAKEAPLKTFSRKSVESGLVVRISLARMRR